MGIMFKLFCPVNLSFFGFKLEAACLLLLEISLLAIQSTGTPSSRFLAVSSPSVSSSTDSVINSKSGIVITDSNLGIAFCPAQGSEFVSTMVLHS